MIDLRSDTVTIPSDEMKEAMFSARVGDDVYGEDPTVNNLQDKVADLFGMEASLFVPTGTMSNQIGLKILTNPGDEIITEADAHIFYYETAAPALLSNVQIRTVKSEFGMMDLDIIESYIRPDIYYFPKTSLICLENTHNRHGGTVIEIDYIKDLHDFAREKNLKLHLDGARLWNAHIATKTPLSEYGKYFDTINVCLSKGLGTPVGSLLISTKENIAKALKFRKILGGGMRQAGYLAAAGLYALENNLSLLAKDHENAKYFAKEINNIDCISCKLDKVETNIVVFDLNTKFNADKFVKICYSKGVILSSIGNNQIRVVFHLDINKNQTVEALEIIKDIFKNNINDLK